MSSSQSTNTQQPRGLPGFLRRTFRNSYAAELAIPGSPILPDDESYTRTASLDQNASGSNTEGGESDAAAAAAGLNRSKSESSAVSKSSASSAASENSEGDAKNAANTTASPFNSSKKHLRAVAFPPLPRQQERGDNDNYSGATPDKANPTTPNAKNNSQASEEDNNNPPPKKSYRELQFETMLSSSLLPLRDLRKLAWNGIPPHHRPLVWKILLGYLPANAARRPTTLQRRRREYKDAIKQHYDIPDDSRTNAEQETLRQVLVDVPRTAPEVPLFHNDRVRRCLSRLLYIWAMRHPASSYVQGINDLATPLVAVFLSGYFDGKNVLDGEVMADVTDTMLEEVEADTYWCLTNLLAGIQDHYTSDQPGMQRMVMHLEELVQRIDADLAAHLKETGIEFLQFAFKWMNCLLLREFRLGCVMRLWDTYLSEGDGGFEDFHVYVCASFLVHFSSELQQMGFDELFQFMQNMPTDDWGDREIEVLLSSAFVLSTLFGDSEAHLNVVRDRQSVG